MLNLTFNYNIPIKSVFLYNFRTEPRWRKRFTAMTFWGKIGHILVQHLIMQGLQNTKCSSVGAIRVENYNQTSPKLLPKC